MSLIQPTCLATFLLTLCMSESSIRRGKYIVEAISEVVAQDKVQPKFHSPNMLSCHLSSRPLASSSDVLRLAASASYTDAQDLGYFG